MGDAQSDPDHIELITDDILDALGDRQSTRFYRLVARKVPESFIRMTLSELKQSTVRSRARVFTSRVMHFAEYAANSKLDKEFAAKRANLAEALRRNTELS